MTDHIRTISEMASTRVSCYPNAGLPDADGKYLETPTSMAAQLERFIDNGWLNIVGGCCGTTDAHIRAIAQMAEGKRAARVRPRSHRAYYSGIELVEAEESNRPLIVGERTNVIGSRLFKNLMAEEKWEEAAEIARRQVKNGAQIIDVCLQSTDRDEMEDIPPFYEKLIRKIKAPVMIDTTDPKAVELALTYCQGKSIINSINLEDGEEKFERVCPLAEALRRGADRGRDRRRQAAGAGVHARAQTGGGAAVRRAADRRSTASRRKTSSSTRWCFRAPRATPITSARRWRPSKACGW